MAWISVHNTINGPKLRNLRKMLHCSTFEAVGILNFLWFWGQENAEENGLVQFADKEDIARYLYGVGAGCTLNTQKVTEALFQTGWLDEMEDGSIYIHDWDIWQAQWYKAKAKRKKNAENVKNYRRNKQLQARAKEEKDGQLSLLPPVEVPKKDEQGKTSEPKAEAKEPEKKPYTSGFETFWEAYPKKAEKANAYKKYMARIKDGYSDYDLLTAAKNYAAQVRRQRTESQYIKQAKSFLGDSMVFLDFLPKEKTEPASKFDGKKNPFAEFLEG